MDGLRKTEFETDVDVLELDIRSVPETVADQLGNERACTCCGCGVSAARQNR